RLAYASEPGRQGSRRRRHTVRRRNQRRPGRLPIRERADSIRATEPRLLEGGQLRGLGYRVLRELCPRKGRRSHPPDSRAHYGAQQTRGPTCHASAGSDWFARGHADACEAEGCGRESSPQFLAAGQSACGWVASTCRSSPSAAADRLCVGEQLESMPRVAEALSSGEIGYQAASVICHLQKHVSELEVRIDEEMWIDNARRFSIKDLSGIAASTWHAVNPEGFCLDVEENFERRQLFISETAGMYRVDGWLDPEAGAALKSAVEALAKTLGADDARTPRQRRAGGLTELTYHAMEAGTMPRRNGVRPHINVNTTIEGVKGELGAAASELQNGMAISSKTV